MELPINDKELATIVSALRLGGDAALYQKLNNGIKEIRDLQYCFQSRNFLDANPDWNCLIFIRKLPVKNLDL